MLRRFESIKNCGIFENFRWSLSTPDFARVNLIYGANGAGKTSLASALDRLCAERGGFSNVSIRMSDTDHSNERESHLAHDAEFERVFVFSEAYVERSHSFTEDTKLEAVLTLGERTVEDEKRIAEVKSDIENDERALPDATTASRRADKALDDEFTAISRRVVDALQRAGGDYRSHGTYSKGAVKARFNDAHSQWVLLPSKDRTAYLATVNSDERPAVPAKAYSLRVRRDLVKESVAALAASPTSVVLDTLRDHEEATSWVELGRRFHEGIDRCIFCGGELSDARKKAIEQHFSDEVERAQATVDGLIREVTAVQNSLRDLLGDGTLAGSLFDDVRDRFSTARSEAEIQRAALLQWLTTLLDALERKRSNVVAPVKFASTEPPAVDGSRIEAAVAEHNERVASHTNLVQEAAKRLELHFLKESEAKVAKLSAVADAAHQVKKGLEERLQAYREELSALENTGGDPLPSAETMARELTRILGRSELSFALLPDGKHYRVTRYGQPARDLSTGERTAITLVQFLEHVSHAATGPGRPIVVIDDPVSSLDSGAAMGISTYIWAETVAKDQADQVFVLTHNFELFRQWDIQIDGLQRSKARAAYPAERYELIAPHSTAHGVTRRRPALVRWPPNEDARKKLRSAYHHEFLSVVREHAKLRDDDTLEHRLDAQLLFPNVLRRMLESFMAFKRPELVGDFTGAMRHSADMLREAGYAGDADALRLLLTRFTHAFSHDESPETDFTISPDEIKPAIAAVFTFMHAIDKAHFNGLCEVIGVDPSQLITTVAPVVDLHSLAAAADAPTQP